MILVQELYAFDADAKNEEEQCNNVSSQVVQKEMMLNEITKRRPNNLEKLYAAQKPSNPRQWKPSMHFQLLAIL